MSWFKRFNPSEYFRKTDTKDEDCHMRFNCSGYGSECHCCKWTQFREIVKKRGLLKK